ncbi:SLATT domain-containing protein [Gottfriedia endophytica]|uniref:SLATT domain-containing protein n=1 Tax=Gottfriedia endophytica TaxID=2820819 RepID=UPI001FD77BAC|nr:SLATT domain-containing protein [Gottfriedia endophytica]
MEINWLETENIFESRIEKEFKDLKRRIKATRQSRIEASKRLRMKHNYFEKITHFYSLVVLILSVWFLNQSGHTGLVAAKVLLVLSLSLTYFTMFLSMRNYKERAGDFENNYQQLDVLINKIDRFKSGNKELNDETLKEFQREYEKLIIGKENHTNVDFYISNGDNREKFKKAILIYKTKEKVLNVLIAMYPILLIILIFLFSSLMKIINKF